MIISWDTSFKRKMWAEYNVPEYFIDLFAFFRPYVFREVSSNSVNNFGELWEFHSGWIATKINDIS